jgi:hypothetical protein
MGREHIDDLPAGGIGYGLEYISSHIVIMQPLGFKNKGNRKVSQILFVLYREDDVNHEK